MAAIIRNIFAFFKRIGTDFHVWLSQCRLAMDRRLAENDSKQLWRILLLCLACTGIVGIILFMIYGSVCIGALKINYSESPFVPDNVFEAAYYLLFANGGQDLYDGSTILGLVFTTIGIVLIAFLTSAITNALERRSQRYLDGETDYLMGKHIVIFGASDYLYSIINEKSGINRRNEERIKINDERLVLQKNLDDKKITEKEYSKSIATLDARIDALANDKAPRQRFLIVTSRDVASLRREVFSFLDKRIDRRDFVFFFGDRTSDEDISKLSLERAKEVFVIGDSMESDDIESYRDSNNMDCVEAIGRYLKEKKSSPLSRRVEKNQQFKVTKTKKKYEDPKDVEVNSVQMEEKDVQFVSSSKSKYGKPLPCHVMFEYQTTFAAFQFSEISADVKEYLYFMPFNYYDLWARKVIVSGHSGELKYQYLDSLKWEGLGGFISENSEETVHLIILGMSKMGIAMALQTAHVCHYPNFKTNNGKRTRITFIDSCADTERDYLKGRFPCMMSDIRTRSLDFSKTKGFNDWKKNKECGWKGDVNGWYDIEWEFIKGRIESDSVRDFLIDSTSREKHIVTIAVCLPKSHQSMAAAMYLPESVYEDCLQILTYQRRSGSIVNTLATTPTKGKEIARYKKLIPFGMIEDGYDSSLDNDVRAMLVSYVYDSYYSLKKGELVDNLEKGRKDPVEWHETDVRFERFDSHFIDWPNINTIYCVYDHYATKWGAQFVMEKLSSAFNANTIETKLRGINYTKESCPLTFKPEEIVVLSRVEHNRWNIEKMLTGYRTLTEEENRRLSSFRGLYLKLQNLGTSIALTDDEKKILKGEFNLQEDAPLTEEMIPELICKVYEKWSHERKNLKGWPLRAHLDICSCEELAKREDSHIIEFDNHLSEAIPFILKKETEILN